MTPVELLKAHLETLRIELSHHRVEAAQARAKRNDHIAETDLLQQRIDEVQAAIEHLEGRAGGSSTDG